MLKNGLNQDFLEKDFTNIENWNKTNDILPNASGSRFWKILELKLWIDSGWSGVGILDPYDLLENGTTDFANIGN